MAAEKKLIHLVQTGGTIAMKKNEAGILDVDAGTQQSIVGLLQQIPGVTYTPVPVTMCGDSSDHPRHDLIDLGRTVLQHTGTGDGMIIMHGTDTMNLAMTTVQAMGVERIQYPIVFLGSMKDFSAENSDAPLNTITAGVFAAHGYVSGVFGVRPHARLISTRFESHGPTVDWHQRVSVPEYGRYAAFVNLKMLGMRKQFADINIEGEYYRKVPDQKDIEFALEKMKERDVGSCIFVQHGNFDGTLDTRDQMGHNERGFLPSLNILDSHVSGIYDHKKGRTHFGSLEKLIAELVRPFSEEMAAPEHGGVVGKVIPFFVYAEQMRRHRAEDSFSEWWEEGLSKLLRDHLHISNTQTDAIINFWAKYSGKINEDLSFDDVLVVDGASDPKLLHKQCVLAQPGAVIMRATGSAGLRLKDQDDTFIPLLQHLAKQEVPVVLTSSSRGECTSFNYGPPLRILKEDLAFFAGTMDADQMLPRVALLNHPRNRDFLNDLLGVVDGDDSHRRQLRRNIQRQLLSGTHYAAFNEEEGEISDRGRITRLYGIETRVDLIGSVHARKAILASFLNEVVRRGIALPDIGAILEK